MSPAAIAEGSGIPAAAEWIIQTVSWKQSDELLDFCCLQLWEGITTLNVVCPSAVCSDALSCSFPCCLSRNVGRSDGRPTRCCDGQPWSSDQGAPSAPKPGACWDSGGNSNLCGHVFLAGGWLIAIHQRCKLDAIPRQLSRPPTTAAGSMNSVDASAGTPVS